MLRADFKKDITTNYQELIQKYGSPLYVVDEQHIEETFKTFKKAFKDYYSNSVISYSVKTNYQSWVCKKLFELDAYPEIICGFELDIVEKLGYLSKNVIVNGPVKTDEELRRVILAETILNVDNYDELYRINKIARELNKTVNIGIRLNTKIDSKDWTRFGFNIENGDALLAAKDIYEKFECLKLVGVHMHLGTSILNVNKYVIAANRIKKFINHLITKNYISLEYIDLGGGFPSSPRLNHYSESIWHVPLIEDYAKEIINELKELLNKYKPKLYVEPGRALISEPIHMLTTVLSAQKNKLIVDAGKNILPSVLFIEHDIQNITSISQEKEDYIIYGPLCMNSDVVKKSTSLKKVKEKDVLLIENVGAYDFSQSMNFIRYQPAWVVLNKGGGYKLIRKRQDIENLVALDIVE